MSTTFKSFKQRSQLAARDQLNNLAAIVHQPLADPDLVLAQALEATRVFVPSELVSIIDAILDGYAVQTAREPLQGDVQDGLPLSVLSIPDHVTQGGTP